MALVWTFGLPHKSQPTNCLPDSDLLSQAACGCAPLLEAWLKTWLTFVVPLTSSHVANSWSWVLEMSTWKWKCWLVKNKDSSRGSRLFSLLLNCIPCDHPAIYPTRFLFYKLQFNGTLENECNWLLIKTMVAAFFIDEIDWIRKNHESLFVGSWHELRANKKPHLAWLP